jgi:SAM-dependent methyltransferase
VEARPTPTRYWSAVDRQLLYDTIGTGYRATRREDPRIACAIWEALADASSVANIGAGTGNYEPRDREVVAIEPSSTMLAQRPAGAAPAVQGVAEAIPLATASVDAAMAVNTDEHWADCARGLAEMRRVARKRVVALTFDHAYDSRFWLVRDYLTQYPTLHRDRGPNLYELALSSGDATIRSVPVPYDCRDGFFRAFWRRPHAYLDPRVRAGISAFHRLDPAHVEEAVQHLAHDLTSGAWYERNHDLLDGEELDLGLRIVIWSLEAESSERTTKPN